jgi:uncharacterized protein YbjQ (UPF0145 family)
VLLAPKASYAKKPFERWVLCSKRSLVKMDRNLVTTTFELNGYEIVQHLGLVRGIIVRSRSVFGQIGAGLQSIVGGNISLYTTLCERTRTDAFDQMVKNASGVGANAILGVRYDATELGPGITEVLCYGSAVLVKPSK